MDQTVSDLIYLTCSVINGRTPDRERTRAMDMEALFRLATVHQMTSVVDFALEKAGVRDARFIAEKMGTVVANANFDHERRAVTDALRREGIWYLPLKGILLKDYYPHPAMRQMCDNDILYDAARTEDVRKIMEAQGFEMKPPDLIEHQEVYYKPPSCVFEMHSMLFDDWSDPKLCLYYQDVLQRLHGEGPEKHFTDEDFYVYMVAHEYKHFVWKGTGIRSLLDVYVFLRHFEGRLDWKYIGTEAEKLGISDFEKKNRSMAMKLFGEGSADALDAQEQEMLGYFISSGAYGIKEHDVANQFHLLGLRYLRERIFLPMKLVKFRYPLFYRYKVLLPFLPFYRLVRGWKNMCLEIRTLWKTGRRKNHNDHSNPE